MDKPHEMSCSRHSARSESLGSSDNLRRDNEKKSRNAQPFSIVKRKFIRYLPEENAYASLGSGTVIVGSIKDISRGGLAFEHIIDLEVDTDFLHVDVFISRNGYRLTQVPCKKVYEVPIQSHYEHPLFQSPINTKRCGLQFEAMTEPQHQKLVDFIENHCTGVVS